MHKVAPAVDFRNDTVTLSTDRLAADAGFPIRAERGVYADASINGTPVVAYLDTGAEVNMIGTDLAKRLNLRTFPGVPMTGVGGHGASSVDEAVIRTIALGGLERSDTVAAVSGQIAALSAATRVPFEAILGYPLFGNSRVIFDFPGERALFS